jgi:NAD(P)-dependent dehydrogenase (short-subunit alcohol dehydrogenase family)
MPATAEEVRTCLRVLELARSGGLDETAALAVERAVADSYREGKRRRKARRAAHRADGDRAALATARRHREEVPSPDPDPDPDLDPEPAATRAERARLNTARRCYVCREPYRVVDTEYHRLCPPCARLNADRRAARCDLRGRRAVITGGRIKIGFHLALKMLRDGADVMVTTRFPADAARRFAEVSDFATWAGRLQVHGVDLLDLRAMTDFLTRVRERWSHLDILVNNAAQTVARPPGYHRAVADAEAAPLRGPAALLDITPATTTGALARLRGQPAPAVFDLLFPAGRRDETGEPLDLRRTNSWVLHDADVTPREWLEVHVVNAFAPFLLTSRLRPLLEASPFPDRYVVQVSAMEGSFARTGKTERHPHTNMAKAALNMLTRTVAEEYRACHIHMNSVDTGWVTDERPHADKQVARAAGFRPPLDVVDGAARVYDPIVRGVNGEPVWGQFLKDYRSVEW